MIFAYDINYDIKYSFDETYVNQTFPYDPSFPDELISTICPKQTNLGPKWHII